MTRDSAWRALFDEIAAIYWHGRPPGPSAYLSALWDEASYEELQEQLNKLKAEESGGR